MEFLSQIINIYEAMCTSGLGTATTTPQAGNFHGLDYKIAVTIFPLSVDQG